MVIRFPSFLQLLLSEFFRTASRTNLIPPLMNTNFFAQGWLAKANAPFFFCPRITSLR